MMTAYFDPDWFGGTDVDLSVDENGTPLPIDDIPEFGFAVNEITIIGVYVRNDRDYADPQVWASERKAIQDFINAQKVALRFNPPIEKKLVRGATKLFSQSSNRGKLYLSDITGSGATEILSDCWLKSLRQLPIPKGCPPAIVQIEYVFVKEHDPAGYI